MLALGGRWLEGLGFHLLKGMFLMTLMNSVLGVDRLGVGSTGIERQ